MALLGVGLETLTRRRANPPPFLAELDGLLFRLSTSNALAEALDSSGAQRLRRPIDAVAAALDEQGAHGSLVTALDVAARPPEDAPAIGLAVLLRLLRQLPSPAVPCEAFPAVLEASASALPSLLRKQLPPDHAALVNALGIMLGNMLVRCGVVARAAAARESPAASSLSGEHAVAAAEDERALRALVFALTPALLRPEPGSVGIPSTQRGAAERATRNLLLYHAERQALRALGGTMRHAGAADATPGSTPSADAKSPRSAPLTPPKVASATKASFASPGVALSPSPARPRGGGLALHSVGTAVMTMFEREFGPGAVEADARPGSRRASGLQPSVLVPRAHEEPEAPPEVT